MTLPELEDRKSSILSTLDLSSSQWDLLDELLEVQKELTIKQLGDV